VPRRLPSVVLVGRPNVGKSTLFNRITGTRRAIVTPVAGTTRDVIAQHADWRGVPFEVVDTGGMFGASEDPMHEVVLQRGRRAIQSADLLVFVVDGRRSTRPTIDAPKAASSFISLDLIRSLKYPRSTAKALAICSTKSFSGCARGKARYAMRQRRKTKWR